MVATNPAPTNPAPGSPPARRNATLVRACLVGACLILAALPILLGASNYLLGLLISALILAGIALAWALLGNLGGMVTFGHAAFFGVGAYASALISARLGVPVLLAIPLAGLCAALSALAMLPTLRLSGPYFALAILAYAQIFRILATEATWLTGGGAGLQRFPGLPTVLGLDLGSRTGSYGLLVATVAVSALADEAIRRSHVGTALRAIAHSEDATRVVGVNSVLLKAWMLLLSAFMTGVFGGAQRPHHRLPRARLRLLGRVERDADHRGDLRGLPHGPRADRGGHRDLPVRSGDREGPDLGGPPDPARPRPRRHGADRPERPAGPPETPRGRAPPC